MARVVILFILGSLPAFFLFGEIRRNAVNVPFMDDWQFVPLLEKASQGELRFGDLWAPHDEHRLLIPRIVIIVSMFAFKGDYRVQCCITFLVVEVISLCFLWLLLRLNGERLGVWITWLLANIALFSPIQFHNWLWPMDTICLILPPSFCLPLHGLVARGSRFIKARPLGGLDRNDRSGPNFDVNAWHTPWDLPVA